MEKVSLPKGTRDFGPAQMAKRQFIIESIKKVFQTYGFQPLETPAMENLSTLEGKYGDEGDSLLFRITDSGNITENLGKSHFIQLYYENAGTPFAETLLTVSFGLEEGLLRLCKYVFKNFSESQIREGLEIQKIIKDHFDYLFIGTIHTPPKNRLKEFVMKESVSISNSLTKFFYDADLSKENYEDKLELNFRRFIKKSLIPEFSKIMGDFIAEKNIENVRSLPTKKVLKEITEKGLRYDLTVPFARYVVMNRHEIAFPFKRYQIQPVWRADRPQKGRYREFFQCDADVVGTDSLVCEAEIILMIKDAFKALGIVGYSIKINHRAILSGLAEIIGAGENEGSLFVAIDKLDKIGDEKVKEELRAKNFSEQNLNLLFEILNFRGTTQNKIDFLSQKFLSSEKGQKGVADFREVLGILKGFGATEEHVEFDLALARGLSYYTGCIFEVKISDVSIGSVSGGGRYDNLTAVLDAKEKSSGVGFSFGIDRIYDAMEELKIFPKAATAASTVLLAHLDEESFRHGLKLTQTLRTHGVAAEIYPDQNKIKKQLEYADRKKIPFVVVIGSEEVTSGILTLKKMETGDQVKLSLPELIKAVQNHP